MNGNLNQPIILPSFGQTVYQNSGVPGVFNPVPIQQTITLPIPVPPTPVTQSIPTPVVQPIPIKTSKRVRIHEDPDEVHKLTTYIDSLLPHVVVEIIYNANLFNDANKVSTMRKLLVKELLSRYYMLPDEEDFRLASIVEELKHNKYTKVSQTIKTPEQAEAYERHKLICRNNYRLKHGLPLLDGPMPTDATYSVNQNGTPIQVAGAITIPMPQLPVMKL